MITHDEPEKTRKGIVGACFRSLS